MKNSIKTAVLDKNAKRSLIFAVGILFIFGLACSGGRSKDAKPIPSEYFGSWNGEDGSTIQIRGDGTGDYVSGGTHVTGGSVEINDTDKTLSIRFFGFGPSLKIDKPPAGNQMTLGGVVYKKSGSSDTKSEPPAPAKPGDTSDVSTPSASEAERLIKASFDDFADAIDDEDFSTFYQNSSADFKASNTADQMKSTFNIFIEKKDRVLPSLRDIQSKSASFTSAPSVTTENGIKVLIADGQFPSKPTSTAFETKYERENGDWKMVKFKVKMQ